VANVNKLKAALQRLVKLALGRLRVQGATGIVVVAFGQDGEGGLPWFYVEWAGTGPARDPVDCLKEVVTQVEENRRKLALNEMVSETRH
jgi:hypothetical protein